MQQDQTRALAAYVLQCAAVFMVSAVLSASWMGPVSLAFLPVPVAMQALSGAMRLSGGLILCAGLGAAVALGSPLDGALNGVIAAAGLILARGIRHGWHYGATVALMAVAVFVAAALVLGLRWDAMARTVKDAGAEIDAALERPLGEPLSDWEQVVLRQQRWVLEHWPELAVGTLFGVTLYAACLAVTLTTVWLTRVRRWPGPVGTFRTFHVPDWVVWLVIVTAAAWYVDYRRPGTPLHAVVWNTGVGLCFLYWLNGLAILAYFVHTMTAMNTRRVGLAGAFGVLLLFSQVLLPLGLFDTWFEFRSKLDRLAEAKRLRE